MKDSNQRTNYLQIITLLSLAVFLILKMRRGFSVSEDQGGIWNIIQGLYVVFGLFVLLSKEIRYKDFPMIKRYLLFMLYIWFLSLFTILFVPKFGVSTLFHFITVPYGVLCLLLFFYVGMRSDIKRYPYILYPTFLIITYILYSSIRSFVPSPDSNLGAIADVYYIVGLLPLIFIYTPKTYRIIPFLIACVAVLMTGKRAGFLALGVILILYFFPDAEQRKEKSFFALILPYVLLLGIVSVIVAKFVGSLNLNMFTRLDRLSEDGGSGRADRWLHIWREIVANETPISFFVGHGYNSVSSLVGGHAHNDFIEIFYNYGIISVILYISFYISLIKECVKMYMAKFTYAKEFMVAIVVSVFLAMFSFYAIDCTHITCCSVCFGLILAEWYKFQYQ